MQMKIQCLCYTKNQHKPPKRFPFCQIRPEAREETDGAFASVRCLSAWSFISPELCLIRLSKLSFPSQ